jgi:hypothetical protein
MHKSGGIILPDGSFIKKHTEHNIDLFDWIENNSKHPFAEKMKKAEEDHNEKYGEEEGFHVLEAGLNAGAIRVARDSPNSKNIYIQSSGEIPGRLKRELIDQAMMTGDTLIQDRGPREQIIFEPGNPDIRFMPATGQKMQTKFRRDGWLLADGEFIDAQFNDHDGTLNTFVKKNPDHPFAKKVTAIAEGKERRTSRGTKVKPKKFRAFREDGIQAGAIRIANHERNIHIEGKPNRTQRELIETLAENTGRKVFTEDSIYYRLGVPQEDGKLFYDPPGNPDIRFMPLLNLPGDKSVQYKKNKNIIDVVFKDATGLQDKFVTMVEADRHDTDGVRMGGPLHAFLKSNDVIVTIDGVDFRPQWANLKWSTIKGMIERVKLTDDGHALIQIMEKETHRSNKDMFSRVLGSFQDNRKNMSVLEREVTANILRILRKRFTKSKPNAQENAFLKDMTQYKTKLTRGNVDEANKILADIKKNYGKTKWWNDKEVKSFAKDFTKAFTDSSFKARAEITSYFLPRDENSARMPFIPDIRKLLKSEMDYHGAKAGDVVGVVQLSKHNLNNKKRVFGVYFGDDPKEFARMTDNEKLARKKLLANKKFRAHPSYDWLMLGPGDADFFMFDKPKNAVQMAPDFAKNHAKLWKQDVAKLKSETIKKYGTTKQDPEDFSVTPDIKQRTERFKGIDKFLKESSKKPLYDQSESNIQGAMLRGHKRGVPQLTQFLK